MAFFMGISLLANLVTISLWARTAYNLKCGIWSDSPPRDDTTVNQRRNRLVKKLIIVLGLTWIAEYLPPGMPEPIYWTLDTINALQGLFMFLVIIGDTGSISGCWGAFVHRDWTAMLRWMFGCKKKTRSRQGLYSEEINV